MFSVYLLLGFAASNISETYDAKIFSVATLLSSYLIYNSVKVSCRLTYESLLHIWYRLYVCVDN